MYADVIIDISAGELDRSFSYRVPREMEQLLRPGMVVEIPFGKGDARRTGYVIGLTGESSCEEAKVKEILKIRSTEETTQSRLISLAFWMKETYGGTMLQALRTVFPIREKKKIQSDRYLRLAISREKAEELLKNLEGTKYKARERLLRAVLSCEGGELSQRSAVRDLGISPQAVGYLEKAGVLQIEGAERLRNHVRTEAFSRSESQVLSPSQKQAVDAVCTEWEKKDPRPVLLCGVTGSGKTLVYMELIEKVISEGKQAIVLIPEISLTYQTVKRFQKRFGDLVSVQNSRLSAGERYDQFLRAKRGEISVMVGPRSALFTPFAHLGLIVIDEEHENAYKSEQTPRYHARETAIERAKNEGASVVLGSATPSLESYYRALRGEYFLVSLSGRYEGRAMPEVAVLDLRKELKEGNRSILSRELQKEIQDRLDKKEQVMLFLNRRGYAGFVSCRSCGEVMQCPHCAVSLSEHQGGRLVCHYCGYEIPKPALCPVCSSPYIGGFKAGTQQVQQVVQKMFPQARVLRMDSDTTRNKGSYEKILSSFASGEADILIGTQMIVKGHDFPRVTLVGAVAADLSLNDSDFRCAERTFQLLTQAAGRAGRGEGEGKAVFQTYHPEHYSIQAAARQDYEEFYREEIGFRSLMEYPPAAHMMAVLGSGRDEEKLGTAMQYLALFIRRLFRQGKIGLIGPAPASVSKVKDIYHQVLYLKHQDITVLAKVRNSLDKYMEINEGFRNIYIQYDVE